MSNHLREVSKEPSASAEGRTKWLAFSIRQVLMAVALVGIGLAAVTSEGCGRTSVSVNQVTFTPNGKYLVIDLYAKRDANVPGKVYFADIRRRIVVVRLSDNSATSIWEEESEGPFIYPGGFRIADNSNLLVIIPMRDGSPLCWDLGNAKWQFPCRQAKLDSSQELSRDKRTVALQTGGRILVKDWQSGKVIRTITSKSHWFDLSPDGKFIAVQTAADVLELNRVSDGHLMQSWSGPAFQGSRVCISRNGAFLAILSRDGLYLADAENGAIRKIRDRHYVARDDGTIETRTGDDTFDAAFSPDGKRLVAVGDYGVEVFSVTVGKSSTGNLLTTEWTNKVAMASDGRTFASVSDAKLVIWDLLAQERSETVRLPTGFRLPWTAPAAMFVAWVVFALRLGLGKKRNALKCRAQVTRRVN